MGLLVRRIRAVWVMALVCAGMLSGGAQAAETVKVRAWAGEGFGRLVFDWPNEVSYEAGLRDGALVMSFSEAANFDLAEVLVALSDYLGGVRLEPGSGNVAFTLLAPVDLQHFRDGLKVVVDLRGLSAEPQASPLPVEPAAAPPADAVALDELPVVEAPDDTRLAGTAAPETNPPDTAPATGPEDGAYPSLGLRSGEHPDFSRLVFDWPESVDYSVEESPGGVLLHFRRPARLDLSLFRRDPLSRVSDIAPSIEAGGLRVVLTTQRGVVLRHFRNGTHVVVDLLGSGEEVTAAAEPVRGPTPAAPVPAPAEAVASEPLEDPASPPPAEDPQVAQVAQALPDRAPEEAAEEPQVAQVLPDPTSESAAGQPLWPVLEPATPAAAAEASSLDETSPVTDRVQPGEDELIPAPGRGLIADGPIRLRFDWTPAPPRAAVFRRGRHLWIVFDQRAADGLAGRIAQSAPELAPVERLSAEGNVNSTVLRLALPWSMVPSLRRDGRTWHVDLRPGPDEPETDLAVEIESGPDDARVLFRASGATGVVQVRDPDLGDRLVVVPIETPGLGLKVRRSFPQFKALATYQGLAVAPLSDGLRILSESEGVSVSDRDGLLVSSGADRRRAVGKETGPESAIRLFDLEAWRRESLGNFATVKQILLGAIINAPPALVDVARLDLARFYFAHGLATETIGVLRLISQENQRFAIDPQVILLRAAAAFLLNDFERAAEILREPALEGEWEASVWQGASAAVIRDWAFAVDRFTLAEPLIADYPPPVRARLLLLAAEARLGIGDTGGASLFLETLREGDPTTFEHAQLDYLEARRLEMDGLLPEARGVWQVVAAGTHRASRARARLALIDLDREQGTLQPDAAIAELERLRFAWRGDDFELALLERLGELYADQLDYQRGLRSLRQVTSYLSRSARAEVVARRMGELFAEVYLGDRASRIAPLTALALFEEFKELTPTGEEGDRVIEVLVDRLVEVDLLEEAAAVLENQVSYRLKGADKARVGARWAVVHLLDRRPGLALEALDKSRPESGGRFLPQDVAAQRRHLRARALADLGRNAEAIALLSGDDAPEALRLRAEVLWSESDWDGAAAALEQLLPEPPPAAEALPREDGETVRNLAVAYSLAARRGDLQELGRRYGKAMDATIWRDDFAMLTSELDAGEVTSVADELAGIARIQAFMTSYRERLQQASLSTLN